VARWERRQKFYVLENNYLSAYLSAFNTRSWQPIKGADEPFFTFAIYKICVSKAQNHEDFKIFKDFEIFKDFKIFKSAVYKVTGFPGAGILCS